VIGTYANNFTAMRTELLKHEDDEKFKLELSSILCDLLSFHSISSFLEVAMKQLPEELRGTSLVPIELTSIFPFHSFSPSPKVDLLCFPMNHIQKYALLLEVFLETAPTMTECEVLTGALSVIQRISGLIILIYASIYSYCNHIELVLASHEMSIHRQTVIKVMKQFTSISKFEYDYYFKTISTFNFTTEKLKKVPIQFKILLKKVFT